MSESQKAVEPPGRARKIVLRILWILVVAAAIGAFTKFVTTISNKQAAPAGFVRGVLHGALMPGTMPNLLIGRDVTIYAPNNKGIPYKLGYTVGVNGCGAIFFGFFFWRLNKWRKRARAIE